MVTVVEALPVPPPPVQFSENVVVAVRAEVVTVPPLGLSLPDQPEPPEAVQLVAFCVDQVRVTVPPEATLVTLGVSVTVGAGITVSA